jgi:UDP-N-acetylglucosamine:LPS N-acetylglucosamine transferase
VEKPNLKKNVLITFGKTPANRIYSVINEISSLDGINLSVICGENSYIYRKIKTMSNIIAYQFVNNIHELIDDNDIIITKPGPTTIFEILARGKYMLIENNAKTMLHEKYNIDFILENKLGQSFATIKELKEKILSIDISNKSKYQFSSPREQIKQIISRQLPD